MEIRTKHLRASFEAGFEAGLEGLKPMEIEAKQYDKEGALFWSSKRKKKQARKNGPPQYHEISALAAIQQPALIVFVGSSADPWRPLQRQSSSSQSAETAPATARAESVEPSK